MLIWCVNIFELFLRAMESREKQIYCVTFIGSVINVVLTVFKFIAGVLGHSSAMIADAVHSLSDLISDAIVLIFVKIAGKPEDSDHNFGHGKYETLATLLVGLLLIIVGIGMLWDGVVTTIDFFKGKELEEPNWWALWAAIISIISKECIFRYTRLVAHRVNSIVLEANAWHHRSDALTSIAALIGIGGAMLLGPDWRVLDPMAAAFVSVFIVITSVKLMMPALNELMEKSIDSKSVKEVEDIISSVTGVTSFHHLRSRRIGADVAIAVHVKMDGNLSLYQAHSIASEVEKKLHDRFGKHSIITVHMEPEHSFCRLEHDRK